MNNTYIRFIETGQIIYPAEGFAVPLTKEISKLENLGGRSSSFSKSIIIDGRKEHNIIFGHLYDVNLETGSFDRKALVPVQIVQGDEVLFEGFLRLLAINNSTNELNQYKKVNYECIVYNEVGKFYQQLQGKKLSELDLGAFDHIYSSSAVTASFNHTWVDGYKYAFGITDDNTYDLSDVRPAIYAKILFDKIFANAGYSYIWDSINSNDVRFDKVLMPYTGDAIKFLPTDYEPYYVQANQTSTQTFTAPLSSVPNGDQFPWSFGITPATYNTNFQVDAGNEIIDQGDLYNPTTSVYTSNFYTTPTQQFKCRITVDFDFQFINPSSTQDAYIGLQDAALPPPDATVGFGYGVRFFVVNQNQQVLGTGTLNMGEYLSTETDLYTIGPNTTTVQSLQTQFVITSSANFSLLPGDTLRVVIVGIPSQISDSEGDLPRWRNLVTSGPSQVRSQVVLNSYEVEFYPDPEDIVFGTRMKLTRLLPNMNQSDFIKAIANLYNLYFDVDPDNANTIIIKTRNEYYDSGSIVDLSDKFLKDLPQNLTFADESSGKFKTIRFKEGKSAFNVEFQNIYQGETYGQITYVLDNLNLKGEDLIELPFEGCQVTRTPFGAYVLAMDGFAPKQLPVLAIDGGTRQTTPYSVHDYYTAAGGQGAVGELGLTTIPYIGHLSDPLLADFDLGFGFPRILGYDGTVVQTQNNLFNLHWRRTFSQVNKSKILEAYFDLSNVEFKQIQLNDVVQLWNSWWNILSIKDYDAASNKPTLIRLIQVDDELGIGAVSATPGVITDDNVGNGFPNVPGLPNLPAPPPGGGGTAPQPTPVPGPVPTFPANPLSPISTTKRAFAARKNIDVGVGNVLLGKYNYVEGNYNVVTGNGNFVESNNQFIDSNNQVVTGSTIDGVYLPLTGGTLTGPLVVQSTVNITGNLTASNNGSTSIANGTDSVIIGSNASTIDINSFTSNSFNGIFVSSSSDIIDAISFSFVNNNAIIAANNSSITPSGLETIGNIVGGGNNLNLGATNTVATMNYNVMLGGQNNSLSGVSNVMLGGENNIAFGQRNGIVGGEDNDIQNSNNSGMLGGLGNIITDSSRSAIIGGENNNVQTSSWNGIFAGENNDIQFSPFSGIFVGASNNILSSICAGIFAGSMNNLDSNFSVIAGGSQNDINGGDRCAIIGGGSNIVNASRSAIIGGQNLTVTDDDTVAVPFLSINDFATFTPRATAPTGVAGRVYFDSVTNKLRCYDGTTWQDLF